MVKVGVLTVAGLATHSPRRPHARARRGRWATEQSCAAARQCLQGAAQNVGLTVSTTQAALQWEHWFCCGGFSIGVVRQTLRLCLLARSNLGYPYIPRPREYRASSRAGAIRHEPPGWATMEAE